MYIASSVFTHFSSLALPILLGLGSLAMANAPQVVPLANRHKDAGLSCEDCHGKGPRKPLQTADCLGCHESYPKVAERTAKLHPNPHDNHLIDLDCGLCHKGHKPQENYCLTCHEEMSFKPKTAVAAH